MGRPPKQQDEVSETLSVAVPKHQVVCISQYYEKARALGLKENVRDVALGMLFDEPGENIKAQVHDIKSGDIKFVVRA